MSIEVRPARREELEAVNRIRRMVNDLHVQGRPKHFRPGFNEALQGHVFEAFESDNFDVLVALIDGEVVGFATVQFIHRPEGPYTLPLDYYHLEEFGVDAAFRRRGVATALLEYMKADARARGLSRIDLDVWSFNDDALAFYEAAGFTTYRRYMEINL